MVTGDRMAGLWVPRRAGTPGKEGVWGHRWAARQDLDCPPWSPYCRRVFITGSCMPFQVAESWTAPFVSVPATAELPKPCARLAGVHSDPLGLRASMQGSAQPEPTSHLFASASNRARSPEPLPVYCRVSAEWYHLYMCVFAHTRTHSEVKGVGEALHCFVEWIPLPWSCWTMLPTIPLAFICLLVGYMPRKLGLYHALFQASYMYYHI